MEPLRARMDLEFGPLPEGLAAQVTGLVNAEIPGRCPGVVGLSSMAHQFTERSAG